MVLEIDTGSPVSIINVADARKFVPESKLYEPEMELIIYCGTLIQCVGDLNKM